MAINTFSQFFFGFTIDGNNNKLNFDEGSGELTATVNTGSFTMNEMITQIKTAMDAVGTQTYTVTVDRSSRLFTISAAGTFDLLISSGTQAGTSVFSLIGFTGADVTALTSHTSNVVAGSAYEPQFKLQSYVAKDDFQELVDPSVNRSADGTVETVSFGTVQFYQMDIKFITDLVMDGKLIKNNQSGVSDARTFLLDITKKRPFEFMPDIDTPTTFDKVILESIPGSQNGTGFRLRELFDQGLPNIFETGVIKLRVVS